jgi:transcriptional regulatory protein RtcR
MSTRATTGRINVAVVDEEIERLTKGWRRHSTPPPSSVDLESLLGTGGTEALDRFDRVQLCDVITVCQESQSLSAAGRRLFAASRERKKTPNDADRLRKYLAKFGLTWESVRE